MRTIVMECQNNGKALELKLERESSAKYFLVLAGMTINIKSGCAKGWCESTGEDEYMFVENETYVAQEFPSYGEAKKVYDIFKAQYID